MYSNNFEALAHSDMRNICQNLLIEEYIFGNFIEVYLNIYKTLTFLRSRAIGSKSMRHIKMVDGSMDSPQYGGHRRPTMMLIQLV